MRLIFTTNWLMLHCVKVSLSFTDETLLVIFCRSETVRLCGVLYDVVVINCVVLYS